MSRTVPLERVRNIGIVAHIDAGKTTTTERILFYTGRTYKMGEVHDGAAVMDWMAQEQERGITITSAATTCLWRDHQINLIDTPGHVDFTLEVERSLRVLDGAIVIFDAVEGVEPQSETVWRQAEKFKVPRLVFINKMDRREGDFFRCVQEIQDRLAARPLIIQIPWREGDLFDGIIDLIGWEAQVYDAEDLGATFRTVPIPSALEAQAKTYRGHLIDALADLDDMLAEAYLSEQPIGPELIRPALRRATLQGKGVPVLCGTSFRNKGVQALLDAVVDYLPSPVDVPPIEGTLPESSTRVSRAADDNAPFSALAFKLMADPYVGHLVFARIYSGVLKTGDKIFNCSRDRVERAGRLLRMHANKREELQEAYAGDIVAILGLDHTSTGDTLCDQREPLILESIEFPTPVISVAIEPKTQADHDKLGLSLKKLSMEDPSFRMMVDGETGQTVIAGMGELHLEVLVDRLLREFQLKARVSRPEVSYRETIKETSQARGRFVRQTGGRGQFGDVTLRVEPVPGAGVIFESKVVGGAIPKEYLSAVRQGVLEAAQRGVLAGYPFVDIKATALDGSYHDVDSSDMAFKIAGSMAFKGAVKGAGLVLLEPIMDVEVVAPEEYLGDIVGDLSSRRGKIQEMASRAGAKVISARLPLAQMFGYATDLRSKTQGRAHFTMQVAGYEEMPFQVAEEIILKKEATSGSRQVVV